MDRGAVIRSFTAADLGFILHSRHQYHWHTGYIPPQPMAMPHIGSVVSRTLGPKNPDMPAFIAIGQTVEGRGRDRHAQGVSHRRLPRHRARPVPDRRPAGRGVGGAAAEGADRRPLPHAAGSSSRSCWRRSRCTGTPATSSASRWCDRSTPPIACCSSPSAKAFDLSLEPAAEPSTPTTPRRFGRGLPAGAPAGRGRRPLRRGDVRVHPVRLLGHARERPRARRGDEERSSTRRSRSWFAISTSAACSTARWSSSPASSAATR